REHLSAAQMIAEATHEITIRYRTGVVPKMRIARTQAGAQVYEIHAVINQELRNRMLLLLCSEVQTVGA
ncbi:MAG TPA: phage head closure protein, partial [Vicinamibacterales bacterium]|nr:phage head closure protein [Vicinamibacterales bacterium]